MSNDDVAAYESAGTMSEQAEALDGQGKYAGPAALREGTGDPPPRNHRSPPLHRFSPISTWRRTSTPGRVPPRASLRKNVNPPQLLGEDHPGTATSFNSVAFNLNRQGKYAQAQPLYEKALEIRRRLLTSTTTSTPPQAATTWRSTSTSRGAHARAQPLHEKALAIRRRLGGEDHPNTAASSRTTWA